jgi:Farnesoic acid 0-methyl transferase
MSAAKAAAKRKASPPPAAPAGNGLSRRGWLVLLAVILAVNIPLLIRPFRPLPEAGVPLPFADDFSNPATVAAHYHSLGGFPRVVNGELLSPGTKNNPLWLKATLPDNVLVEFDAHALSQDGEIRVEIFGNGIDHLSGYELIYAPWNAVGVTGRLPATLVRLDENAPTLQRWQEKARAAGATSLAAVGYGPKSGLRVEGPPVSIEPGRVYRMRIERRGDTLRWWVDGQRLVEFSDPFPLRGPWHDRVGLSSVEGDVYYDNFRVLPLDATAFVAEAPVPAVQPGPSSDDFERTTLGNDWLATDPTAVRLDKGSLLVERGHNHPVWLRRPIPEDAVIEFDAWTDSPDGDIKVEAWGDGRSAHNGPLEAAYDASGYVFVFGGWKNSKSVIARQEEHGPGSASREGPRVEPGRRYHFEIRRKGGDIQWSIDGVPYLALKDTAPLRGPSHAYFAFSGWESPVHFDNVRIR